MPSNYRREISRSTLYWLRFVVLKNQFFSSLGLVCEVSSFRPGWSISVREKFVEYGRYTPRTFVYFSLTMLQLILNLDFFWFTLKFKSKNPDTGYGVMGRILHYPGEFDFTVRLRLSTDKPFGGEF